jgi:hypothetical protein
MVVVEKIGYDLNSKTPKIMFKKDEQGEILKNEHGEPIIDTDIPEIISAFKEFKRKYSEIVTKNYGSLFNRIAEILTEARSKVVREINKAQVLAYWEIGREIVEFEQKGKIRAKYGEELIKRLSKDMTQKFE